jgi:hypothetical protein
MSANTLILALRPGAEKLAKPLPVFLTYRNFEIINCGFQRCQDCDNLL